MLVILGNWFLVSANGGAHPANLLLPDRSLFRRSLELALQERGSEACSGGEK